MADPIYIRLSKSGLIREAPLSENATRPWHACNYGEFLGTFYGYLDEYAAALDPCTRQAYQLRSCCPTRQET
jgi:hypothetical protein